MSRPLVHLVDGSGYIFRAYYAIRALSTSAGEPTNAVHGFAEMIQKVLSARHPTHIAIVFDVDRKSFRTAIYPDYKAHRSAPPEDLPPQIPRIHQVSDAYRLRKFAISGVEADDVIATLARQATEAGFDVEIISGDKDLLQLVSDRVTVYEPMKNLIFHAPQVVEKFGVPPERLADLFALAGDTSDNIPGIRGVGPKTAAKLIQEHGTLDGVLAAAAAGKIKGKLGENVAAGVEMARLSRRLVTLDDRVELGVTVEDLRYPGPDLDAQRALFAELELRRLLGLVSEAQAEAGAPAPAAEPTPARTEPLDHQGYAAVDSPAALDELLAELASASVVGLSLDLDHPRLVDARLVGLALSTAPGRARVLVRGHGDLDLDTAWPRLLDALARPALEKRVDDVKALVALGLRAGRPLAGLAIDPSLASHLLEPDDAAHDVRTIGRRRLGLEGLADPRATSRRKKGEGGPDPRALVHYLGEGAELALRVTPALVAALAEAELTAVATDLESPLVPVLAKMELAGVAIDLAAVHALGGTFAAGIERAEKACHEAAGHEFNPDSPVQLKKILYEELGLRVVKQTEKSGPSTDASALEQLVDQHPLPAAVLEYRQLKKLKSTYTDALPKMVCPATGRVHTRLSQLGAATGRLSSSEPNLQNIPIRSELGRQLRRVFIAPPGRTLISVDYSQIELRVLAHFSEEPVLVAAFAENADVHTRTASVLFEVPPDAVTREQRAQAKAVNFGVLYGMGPVRLARDLGIPRRTASKFIDDYFARQPRVAAFIEATLETARKTGLVRTLLGRRRRVPDLHSKNRAARAAGERIATNTPIQGSAADLMKLAMIRVSARLDELATDRAPARLLLQVHDELLLEADEDLAPELGRAVQRDLEGVFPLAVPLVAEPKLGRSWADAH